MSWIHLNNCFVSSLFYTMYDLKKKDKMAYITIKMSFFYERVSIYENLYFFCFLINSTYSYIRKQLSIIARPKKADSSCTHYVYTYHLCDTTVNNNTILLAILFCQQFGSEFNINTYCRCSRYLCLAIE